jgi:hypothetical protein
MNKIPTGHRGYSYYYYYNRYNYYDGDGTGKRRRSKLDHRSQSAAVMAETPPPADPKLEPSSK